MKKNIIMIIITLVCSVSLLLVLYFFNTKDIYYVSDKIIDNNEITMQIKSGSTYTDIIKLSDLDNAKYYRISSETNCSLGSANFYYSNSTNRLKVKVTSSPLKCKIVFEEIKEDINIVAIYVNDIEQALNFSFDINKFYFLSPTSTCSNGSTLSWDNDSKKISISGLTGREYCTAKFLIKNSGETEYHFIERMIRTFDPTLTENTYTSLNALIAQTPLIQIINNRQIMQYIGSNQSLLADIKNTNNYGVNYLLFAQTTLLTQEELYEYGFPFYAFKHDSSNNVIDGLYVRVTSANNMGVGVLSETAFIVYVSEMGKTATIFGRRKIDVTKYKKLYLYYVLQNDTSGMNLLSNTCYAGLEDDLNQVSPTIYDAHLSRVNSNNSIWTIYVDHLDISSLSGSYYFKASVAKGSELQTYTTGLMIYYIAFY